MRKHLSLAIALLTMMPCSGNAAYLSEAMLRITKGLTSNLGNMDVVADDIYKAPRIVALSECKLNDDGSIILANPSYWAYEDKWGWHSSRPGNTLILYPAFFELPEETLIQFARYFSQIKRTKEYYFQAPDHTDMKADVNSRYPGFLTFFDAVKESFKETPDALCMRFNGHPIDYAVTENGEVLLCESAKSLRHRVWKSLGYPRDEHGKPVCGRVLTCGETEFLRATASTEEPSETPESDISQSDLDAISNIFEAAERIHSMDQEIAHFPI